MKNDQINIDQIMGRVYQVYWLRRIKHSLGLKVLVVVAAGIILSRLVSVTDVLRNSSQMDSIISFSQFWWWSFLKTNFMVQGILALGTLTGLWLVRDIHFWWSLKREQSTERFS